MGDFDYLAKFTGFVTCELVEEYFDMCMDKYPDGKMDKDTFIKMFNIAFPTRPMEKVQVLADELENANGKISMANMLILFYLFCSGKMEDNLAGIFNLFDQDGNKIITLNELYELMSVFIEIAEGKENNLDLAKVMAEKFKLGMVEPPVTGKILREKTLDSLLATM